MRVLAINDISCVGKCSLGATLPILSACGVECNVLPTALLSTHTGGFSGYTFLDLTDEISKILSHWQSLGLKFDYIYSGYLGSERQIDLLFQIKKTFLKTGGKFIVDPVMGDSGALYNGFTQSYVKRLKTLCQEADYILPNATEACLLTDEPYPPKKTTCGTLLQKLQAVCPRPVITGIDDGNDVLVAYPDAQGSPAFYAHENVEGFFCGAGDVFASAFVGCLARGKDEQTAIRLASDFVTAAIRRSAQEVPDKRYGLPFEKEIFPFLQKLNKIDS